MTGYGFHPEAEADLVDIWEYIAFDNVDAADRMTAEFHKLSKVWSDSPIKGSGVLI